MLLSGVNLLFAHDTEVFLQAAAALVNTADPDGDQLPDVAALDEFVRTWGWTGIRHLDQDELDSVRELRPRLRQFWSGDLDDVVASVNRLLAEAHAVPQLVRHDEWDDYHIHATPDEAPLATRMAVEAAMAITDVIRAGELSRLRRCEYPGCASVVVDLSRNRSKRYCDGGCGNRAAVAAYRARKVARSG
jgi:predicted RNA-binding Zn ribbon-like protein